MIRDGRRSDTAGSTEGMHLPLSDASVPALPASLESECSSPASLAIPTVEGVSRRPCINQCGFFGSETTDSYCSKCWRVKHWQEFEERKARIKQQKQPLRRRNILESWVMKRRMSPALDSPSYSEASIPCQRCTAITNKSNIVGEPIKGSASQESFPRRRLFLENDSAHKIDSSQSQQSPRRRTKEFVGMLRRKQEEVDMEQCSMLPSSEVHSDHDNGRSGLREGSGERIHHTSCSSSIQSPISVLETSAVGDVRTKIANGSESWGICGQQHGMAINQIVSSTPISTSTAPQASVPTITVSSSSSSITSCASSLGEQDVSVISNNEIPNVHGLTVHQQKRIEDECTSGFNSNIGNVGKEKRGSPASPRNDDDECTSGSNSNDGDSEARRDAEQCDFMGWGTSPHRMSSISLSANISTTAVITNEGQRKSFQLGRLQRIASKSFNSSVDLVKKNPRKAATVACGGIVGGVAGLAIGGPAGMIVGVKLGQIGSGAHVLANSGVTVEQIKDTIGSAVNKARGKVDTDAEVTSSSETVRQTHKNNGSSVCTDEAVIDSTSEYDLEEDSGASEDDDGTSDRDSTLGDLSDDSLLPLACEL